MGNMDNSKKDTINENFACTFPYTATKDTKPKIDIPTS